MSKNKNNKRSRNVSPSVVSLSGNHEFQAWRLRNAFNEAERLNNISSEEEDEEGEDEEEEEEEEEEKNEEENDDEEASKFKRLKLAFKNMKDDDNAAKDYSKDVHVDLCNT